MAVKKNQVFLISGQMLLEGEGELQLAPEVVQQVVVADDVIAAYALLKTKRPFFKAVGHASLQEYEDAAAKLRAVLKGESTEWSVLVAPGMDI